MPRKLPPHVERNRVKGKTYLSFRIGKGPRLRLPDDPMTDEFRQAYADALAGTAKPKRLRRDPTKPGSLSALVESYMRSLAYVNLRATTKKGYATRINILREKHGDRSVAGLTRERILKGILGPYADRPGQAHALLKMLRVLIRHAIDIGLLRHDPSLGIRRPRIQQIRSWTDAEIAAFEKRWPVGTRQRTAFALMLYTGQRRSDVHRMTWAHIANDAIRVTQQKTGAELSIPLHSALAGVLAASEKKHVAIITTEYGKPFTVAGFSTFMRAAISAAELPLSCQPHGLRKAAGRRLAEAGCTAREIMAVLGHKTLSEAERYTSEADQAMLAKAAMTKHEGRTENKFAQTDPRKFGNRTKKGGKSK